MSGTQVIARNERMEILAEAVRQRRRLVLTAHAADGWRLLKGKFGPSDRGGETLAVEIELSDTGGTRPGAITGQSVGCTFRVGHKKCMFCSVVEGVDDRPGVTFIRLKAPGQLQQLQRRAYERVAPPQGTVIAVRFWKDIEGGERHVRHGQMEDISAGGLRIRVADPTGIELETMYRCVFTPRPGKPAFVIDGLLRHKAALDNGRASLGFQFIGLETTDEGQRALDRLARFVGQLHRSRQRRNPPRERGQAAPDQQPADDA